jgi:hypothetical protein
LKIILDIPCGICYYIFAKRHDNVITAPENPTNLFKDITAAREFPIGRYEDGLAGTMAERADNDIDTGEEL